jgi:hypothetical protein
MAFQRWGWEIASDAEIVVVGFDGPGPFQAARRGWNLVEDLARMDVALQNSCAGTTRRLAKERPDLVLRYVRAYCQGVYRFRTDAGFGIEVLRKYTGESDPDVLVASWVMFARLMGGMMFPSLEGVRNAARLLHELGAAPPRAGRGGRSGAGGGAGARGILRLPDGRETSGGTMSRKGLARGTGRGGRRWS